MLENYYDKIISISNILDSHCILLGSIDVNEGQVVLIVEPIEEPGSTLAIPCNIQDIKLEAIH